MKKSFRNGVLLVLLGFLLGKLYADGTLTEIMEDLFSRREIPLRPAISATDHTTPTETQVPQILEIIDPNRPRYNLGRCATLAEDAHVIAFFLDDNESWWTAEEADAFLQTTLRPGLDRIESEAARYGRDLHLGITPVCTDSRHAITYDGIFHTNYSLDENGEIQYGSPDSGKIYTQLFNDTVRNLGFRTDEEMHAHFQQETGSKQVAYCFVSKKGGYSYAHFDATANNFSGFESAILYSRDVNGETLESRAAARLVLALFGGGYSSESVDGREPTLSVARRLYPYSLVFGGYSDTCCWVDPYTAYAVGWRNQLPPENMLTDAGSGESVPGDPYRPMFDKGTCRNFSGKIYLLTIYVDDEESSWSQEEIDAFHQQVTSPALNYLAYQAQNRNIPLEFSSGYYSTDLERGRVIRYPGILGDSSQSSGNADVLDHVAMSMDFSSKIAMYDHVLAQSGADQLAIMVAMNKTGRSYACCDKDNNPNHNLEYTMVYRNHWKSQKFTTSTTVAHELLHLFGAEDMYQEESDGRRAQRAAIAKQLFPNDIMFAGYYEIWDNVLSKATTYTIGWSDVPPDACTTDAWWENA